MHPYLLDTIYFNLILHLHMHQFALFACKEIIVMMILS